MKKVLLLSIFSGLAGLSVALAAKPKPMDCDAWECKGNSCAPAKYVAVRQSPILRWLEASPMHQAFVYEGGGVAAALLVVGVVSGRRRRSERWQPMPLPADEG